MKQLILLCLLCPSLTFAFDHQYRDYENVLQKYVENGRVDYAALQKNRSGIDRFVTELSRVASSEYDGWSREEQLAFWINAYNGWFLKIVIDHYPIEPGVLKSLIFPRNSIQHIPGIWKGIRTEMAGKSVTLDEIEHRILRPVFQEPRIHFAIVCASQGCPVLKNSPYRAATLETQLEESARQFVNNPEKVSIEPAKKSVRLSKIFDWFSEDFNRFADPAWLKLYSKDKAGPLAFVSRHLDSDLASDLKGHKYSVGFLDYDWSLNEVNNTETQRHGEPK